jgi:hypothetical protein
VCISNPLLSFKCLMIIWYCTDRVYFSAAGTCLPSRYVAKIGYVLPDILTPKWSLKLTFIIVSKIKEIISKLTGKCVAYSLIFYNRMNCIEPVL